MRVISGSARRLLLKAPAGLEVRPTTDRIKETLFNMINAELWDCDFLDLFAGSGAIGIEALSRGAHSAVFVDSGRAPLECIRDNLRSTKLEGGATVYSSDAVNIIPKLFSDGKRFDIIFMDPPYDKGLEREVLRKLSEYPILKEDGFIIVEASKDTSFDYLGEYSMEAYREKSYGSNKHIFIKFTENRS